MKIIALTVALLASSTALAQMAPMPVETGSVVPAPMQTAYPRCSATVQDQCIQSPARESDTKGGPPAHGRMMMHHYRHCHGKRMSSSGRC